MHAFSWLQTKKGGKKSSSFHTNFFYFVHAQRLFVNVCASECVYNTHMHLLRFSSAKW